MRQTPKVRIDGPAFLGIVLAAIEVFDCETYGILIGTKRGSEYVVKHAVSYQTTRRKKAEVSMCDKRAQMLARHIKGVSPYHYIGEFHSHPNGPPRLSDHDKKDMTSRGESLSILVVVERAKKHKNWRYSRKDKSLHGSIDDEFFVILKAYIFDHVKKKVLKVHLRCPHIDRLNRLKKRK